MSSRKPSAKKAAPAKKAVKKAAPKPSLPMLSAVNVSAGKKSEMGVVQQINRIRRVSSKTGKKLVTLMAVVKFKDGNYGYVFVNKAKAEDLTTKHGLDYVDKDPKPKDPNKKPRARKPRAKKVFGSLPFELKAAAPKVKKARPHQSVETYVQRYRERCDELVKKPERCAGLATARGLRYKATLAAGKKPRVGALRSCDDIGATIAKRAQKKKGLSARQTTLARALASKRCADARESRTIGRFVVHA